MSGSDILDSTVKKPPLLRRLSQGRLLEPFIVAAIFYIHKLILDLLNVTVLVNYGRENIGSIFSILDSIWNILKGNLSLVFKSTTAILSILMGGGTAILNFFVNGVMHFVDSFTSMKN